MDYTKQIFEMLGVEPEEEFRLKFIGGDEFIQTKGKYKLDKNLKTFWFNDNICEWRRDLDAMFLAILNGTAQIVKIPHPTAEELLAIDYARACGFKWMAKDEGGTIHAFEHKPVKSADRKYWFSNELNTRIIAIGLPISFLQCDDEEPFYIGDESW